LVSKDKKLALEGSRKRGAGCEDIVQVDGEIVNK